MSRAPFGRGSTSREGFIAARLGASWRCLTWVDVMNAAADRVIRREKSSGRADLSQVEICSRSGLLATDKCYGTRSRRRTATRCSERTTYTEIGDVHRRRPTEPCNVHGEPRARLARVFPAERFCRGAASGRRPERGHAESSVKSATLLADTDPYNSLKPTLKKPEPAAERARSNRAERKGDSVTTGRPWGSKTRANLGAERQRRSVYLKRRNPLPRSRKSDPGRAARMRSRVEIRRAVPVETCWTRKARMKPS